jgi:hypothetical protein
MATMQERALEELDSRYEIRNAREVSRYLAEYPELEPVLIEAYRQIHKIFGDDARASLDFSQDYEEVELNSLIVEISSGLNFDVASAKLDSMDKWSIEARPRFSGSIIFELNLS